MSTRSNSSNLFSPLRDPESLIRRRNLGESSSLLDFEEVMSIPHNNMGPPPAGPPPPNNNGPPPMVRPIGQAPRSMKELCQPSIDGRGGPIASIPIQAMDFGLRHHMIQQVQNTCQFHGLPGDDANRHIDQFLEITQHMKQNGVSDDALRLSLFPYSLTHHAIAWYDRHPRNSIHSFDDMIRKFLSKYLPRSMVTKLRNEIMKFEQKPHESLFEARERYKLSIDRCPNHNMLLVTQIDTFYNGLTLSHRDTINAAAGGNFMQKTPEECYELIENMTAHHNHWDTSATRDETSRNISSTTTTTESLEVVRQLEMMNKNFVEMMRQIQTVKTINTKCETCGGPYSFTEFPTIGGYTQKAVYATTAPNLQAPNYQAQVGPSNELTSYMKSNEAILRDMRTQMTNMKTELRNEFKSSLDARTNKIENQNNQMMTQNNELKNMMANFFQMQHQNQNQSTSGSGSLPSNTVTNPRGDLKAITTRSGVAYDGPTIPPTSSLPKVVERENKVTKDTVQPSTENIQPSVVQVPILEPEVAPKSKPKPTIPYPSRLNDQKLHEKNNDQILQIFQKLHFNISFADALLYMPKFALTFKGLLSNKEKLIELANTPLNENCSVVLLKKLPEKLGDPRKFLIPCDFSGMVECLALANLGASINLMPLSVWKQLSLPDLTSTLVDFDADPRVPLILGRPFLRTTRALIDVYGEEITLRYNDEAIIFNVWHTSSHSYRYDDASVNQIDVIDVTCEEYAQEVLGFLDKSSSGNPTPTDPIIASPSPSFTPFEGGDFILEEIDTFLHTPDELSNLDDDYYDMEGDILNLEKLLNEDPSPTLPPMKNDDLKQIDVTLTKPSIKEPPELELKDLPSHLEYAFLEGTNKLPVIISKELKDKEKAALLK
ncbi:reverse transcriptase domain-containing protein, partial [Tanacetum coccineum]